MKATAKHLIFWIENLLIIVGIIFIISSLFLPALDFVEWFGEFRRHESYGYENLFTPLIYLSILLAIFSIFSKRSKEKLRSLSVLFASIFLVITALKLYSLAGNTHSFPSQDAIMRCHQVFTFLA